jgi:hypothetical protein
MTITSIIGDYMALVKYKSKDGKYVNIGYQLESGFVLPIRAVVSKHYYQLLDLAKEITIDYKKKGE